MYLASVVIFRFVFGTLYVLKWQCRYACNKKYKIEEYQLEQVFKDLKKNKFAAESSDDVEDRKQLEEVAANRQKTLKKKAKRIARQRRNNRVTKREMLEETKRLLIEEDIMTNMDDSDDDRKDFIDAKEEEVTDNLIKSYRMKSRPLKTQEVAFLSQGFADNIKGSVLS